MPSVEDHAVFSPAVMPMWPSILVVVVLPLVPVTEATGTVGTSTAGLAPGAVRVISSASCATASSPSSHAARVGPSALPRASPRPRRLQTKATTTDSGELPGLLRTPRRLVPLAVASRRTARSTTRATNRWRCSEPGAPGRLPRRPVRRASPCSDASSASR